MGRCQSDHRWPLIHQAWLRSLVGICHGLLENTIRPSLATRMSHVSGLLLRGLWQDGHVGGRLCMQCRCRIAASMHGSDGCLDCHLSEPPSTRCVGTWRVGSDGRRRGVYAEWLRLHARTCLDLEGCAYSLHDASFCREGGVGEYRIS